MPLTRNPKNGTSGAHHTPALAVISDRPLTRGDCADGPRPCPWVGCRYHLLVDATQAGTVLVNDPGRRRGTSAIPARLRRERGGGLGRLREWERTAAEARLDAALDAAVDRLAGMSESCALDVAESGGRTLEEVGELLGLTRERVRQIEAKALGRLRKAATKAEGGDRG